MSFFNLYVLYDRITEEYSPIFQQRNHTVCARSLSQLSDASSVRPSEQDIFILGFLHLDVGKEFPLYITVPDSIHHVERHPLDYFISKYMEIPNEETI